MSEKKCSVDGCTNKYYGKEYCEKHYQRARKSGGPEDREGHHLPLSEKFFMRVEKTDSCWNWVGPTRKGYGSIWVDGKNVRVHRASWVLKFGEIPSGLLVLHKCDNPSCVNPDHLYIGTQKDNMKDKVDRNRCAHRDNKGEHSGRAVLTNEMILAIRSDTRMNKDIADSYSVDKSTISDIKRRKSWKHI